MSENKENEKLTFDREKGGKWIGCRVNKIRSRFVARNDLHEIYLSIVAIWSFEILQLIIKIVVVVFVIRFCPSNNFNLISSNKYS